MSTLGQNNPFYTFFEELDKEYSSVRNTLKKEDLASLETKVVMVTIGEFRYVLKVGVAVEAIKFKQPQLIPRSYEWVLGVVELRGEVIPVFDIGEFNNQGKTTIDQNSRLVIVRYGQLVYAILVSAVRSVVGVSKFFALEKGCGVEKPDNSLINFCEWVAVENEKLCFLDLEALEGVPSFLKITY